MINQLFNKFNNLFVFDPDKKSRKLLTLWKIPTHALKVLICTKKRHWTFRNSDNSGVVTLTGSKKPGLCPKLGGTLAALGEDRVSGSGRELSIKSGWADNAVRVRVLIKMSPARLSPGSGGRVAVLPSAQNANVHSNMDFSLEDLKFYAALRSKQRDWFSIASWLVGDSLQREEEQEVCGKWNMFWQLWPELLTAEEGLGTTGGDKRGLTKNRDKLKWHGCMFSFYSYLLLSPVYKFCVSADYIFTPDQKFLAALLCLCSISHCWRGWKTKMHLDRGERTSDLAADPQRSRSCSATVHNQNKSSHLTKSYTKSVYKVQLT